LLAILNFHFGGLLMTKLFDTQQFVHWKYKDCKTTPVQPHSSKAIGNQHPQMHRLGWMGWKGVGLLPFPDWIEFFPFYFSFISPSLKNFFCLPFLDSTGHISPPYHHPSTYLTKVGLHYLLLH
jgi:hypothetical protein